LNPGVPVVVAPDRVAGMLVASTKGADCAVLDDAFQHRRASRLADFVLVSADRWTGRTDLLPAGPFREPLSSLRRADAIIITVKAADAERIGEVAAAVRRAAPDVAQVLLRLVPGPVHLAATIGTAHSPRSPRRDLLMHPPSWLAGRDLVVVSAIGDPAAFEGQLRALGVSIRGARRFSDHHKFSAEDAVHIAASARGTSGVICTLKDAVKLLAHWPREGPPLWYLSQSVVVERGAEVLERALARVLAARPATAPTAG
jgi:tetraacyldisaccharide 4'-kinase